MFINKIGMEHIETGVNCQDYGFVGENIAYICDGCSEGKHSEVGAKLFCRLIQKHKRISDVFLLLTRLFDNDSIDLKNFLCFTILKLREEDNYFAVENCGDGFLILQDYEDNIEFVELTDGEYPKYYIYNYVDKDSLKYYNDGVDFDVSTFYKKHYKKVGIASDGLRYILQADNELKNEFIECLKSGKELKTKLFINRNHKIFKDDITIIF